MELTLQDLARFYGCSLRTAQDRAKEIKNYFGFKGRVKKIHLAKYEGLSLDDINLILGSF